MPIVIRGQTYSLGPLGSIIALLVIVACFVFYVTGHASVAWVLALIAALALAILL